MKKLILLLGIIVANVAFAQRNKTPKMAPLYSKGYYVTPRNDTIWGSVQNNPQDPTDFYHEFWFRLREGQRPRKINMQRAKAYGFKGRHFEMQVFDSEKLYAERLVEGRLNFYEYRFHGKVDGYPGVESQFFIQDTGAEGDEADLKEVSKISNKFYKKNLKPYMKDQLMIWDDLDKYNFNKETVVSALKEFNNYYAPVAN